MKKIILYILILLSNPLFLKAQWIVQNSGTTNYLYDIEFINKNTGWASGAGGKIIKTTNGGIDWVNQPNPSAGSYVNGIHPVDSNVVYAVGWFETIMKTTNGGDNWFSIRSGVFGQGKTFDGLFFIDQNTGWICGNPGYVLKTTDAGITFDSTYIPWGYLTDMYFKDANTGMLSAEGSGLFKTTNGGNTWIQKFAPTGFVRPNFYKISFIGDHGWVTGSDRRVFKTTDFGDTWDSVGYVYSADQPYGVRFSSMNTGWIGGTFEELFKSTDGGSSWRRENTGSFAGLFLSSWFLNDSVGWVCGSAGRIQHTITSGQTNIKQLSNIVPDKILLQQNYPNPFNPVTNIEFAIIKTGYVSLLIYDMLGKEVTSLVQSTLNPGTYNYDFDASNLTSGIYFYKLLFNGNIVDTKKMLLIK